MKFDFCIGNPPYQGDNHQQLYPSFYVQSQKIANCVELIFPTGWQSPKNANNLRLLNNKDIKEDVQIVFIDNKHNVFQGILGAEWTNVVMWKKGHDNGLNGKQKIFTNGSDPKIEHLNFSNQQINKPSELIELYELIKKHGEFKSLSTIVSSRKPYGLSTDIMTNAAKYGLKPLQDIKKAPTDITVYCKGYDVKYVPYDYELPKTTKSMGKYKVFVPYAWGNMSEKAGLGGAFSNVIIAKPNEICTESYLESGCFDDINTAKKHAKYFMTKFLRALLYINKFSQHSTTAWGAIPIQDYSETWWSKSIADIDIELMKKYQIPDRIANFVFDNIQTKTEANIVNYKED